jgi:F-type H+-transporting ATPase subunit epsilon
VVVAETANSSMKLTILSPERRLVDGLDVETVTLPGSEGQIQVLAGHAPMVSSLETGVFSYKLPNGQEETGLLTTGFLEVMNDQVIVMAETLELQGEIDVSRAREAQKKAESALLDADMDEHKFRKYQLKLQRSILRQQFGGRSS